MSTDQRLADYDQALKRERQQRQSDNADRMKEITSWQTISETLSSQVATQQKYLSDFDALLGVTSGSEAEKQKAALAAIDTIKADAKALELQNGILKIASTGALVVLAGVGAYEGGRALKWW